MVAFSRAYAIVANSYTLSPYTTQPQNLLDGIHSTPTPRPKGRNGDIGSIVGLDCIRRDKTQIWYVQHTDDALHFREMISRVLDGDMDI